MRNSSSEYVIELLKHGADLRIVDDRFHDALYIAIFRGVYPIISLLLQAGANINRLDENRETMLHQFVRMGDRHHEISILLHYGINFTITNQEHHTAYELALILQDHDTADFILDTLIQFKEDVPRLIG